MVCLLFAFYFIFSPTSYAKVLKFKGLTTPLPQQTLLKIYQDADSIVSQLESQFDNPFTATLFQKDNDVYLHVLGLSYIFKYNNGEFENIYRRNFHGYNFSSYTFTYQNKILNYGGSGFWRTNNNLILFDDQLKEWEFIMSSEEVTDNKITSPILYFSYGNQLYFLTTDNINTLRNGLIDSLYHYYAVDLDQLETRPLGSRLKENESVEWKGYGLYCETDQYVLLLSRTGLMYRIIDKKNLTYKDITKEEQNLIKIKTDISYVANHLILAYSYGNMVQFYDKNLSSLLTLDIDLLYHSFGVEKNLIANKSSVTTLLLIFAGFFIVGGLIQLLKTRDQSSLSSKEQVELDSTNFPYPELLKINQQIISQEVLDQYLRLQNLSPHSIRNKRSAILRSIKIEHAQFINIERIPDPIDGRIYQYKIHVFS